MSDKSPPPAPDYAALAQRYLELWQDQVAKLAKDPPKEMGDLSTMTAAWSKMAASMTAGASGPMAPAGASEHDPHRPASTAPAYGDGGTGAAGGDGGPDAQLATQLATRVGVLEQRLAALESRLAGLADATPAKPRAASGGRGPRKKT